VHPAPSLIVFTTLSGAGFGLMAVLSLGLPRLEPGGFFLAVALAFGLSAAGLVISLFHLGHPERAWRALSQWRSSWLSREGVLALATLAAFAAYAGARLMFGVEPVLLGGVAALLCTATVFATAMIYASLRAVPLWNSWLTPACYLLFSAAGGVLLAAAIATAFGDRAAGLQWLAILLLAAAWLAKALWWRGAGSRAFGDSTPESATGLGQIGHVRLFEAPHTSPNYLMTEMVFHIGRKHSARLQAVSVVLGGALPAFLIVASVLAGSAWPLLVIAAASHLAGILAERWLFFAEAKHVVALYYGFGERRPGDEAKRERPVH
jgi:sulfite dehydrogenase (quinone) subunit SoeC